MEFYQSNLTAEYTRVFSSINADGGFFTDLYYIPRDIFGKLFKRTENSLFEDYYRRHAEVCYQKYQPMTENFENCLNQISNQVTSWVYANAENVPDKFKQALNLLANVKNLIYVNSFQPVINEHISDLEQYLHNVTTDYMLLRFTAVLSLQSAVQNSAPTKFLRQERNLNSFFIKLAPTSSPNDNRYGNTKARQDSDCRNNIYRQNNFSYSFHAEDLVSLWGLNFCHENYECYMKCNTFSRDENYVIDDKQAALNMIYFYFDESEKSHFIPKVVDPITKHLNYKIYVLGQDGYLVARENFWDGKFQFYENILPEIYDDYLVEDVVAAGNLPSWNFLSLIFAVFILVK